MRRLTRILAIAFATALVLAACGSDDASTDASDQTDEAEQTSEDDAMEDEAMEDEESDDAMEDDAMEDEESDDAMEDEESDDAMEDDAMAAGLHGLEIVSINFDTAEVVIANNGDADVTLDGYFLCNFPDYAAIADVGSVAPGETVTVTSPVGLSPAAGELGLYTTDSYSSPDAIQAYVEWGSADHERSSVAVEAGIWDGTPLVVEGNTLTVG